MNTDDTDRKLGQSSRASVQKNLVSAANKLNETKLGFVHYYIENRITGVTTGYCEKGIGPFGPWR